MNRKIKCEWNTDNKTLRDMNVNTCFGPYFDNNNWSLSCSPEKDGDIFFVIELHQLTSKVQSIN